MRTVASAKVTRLVPSLLLHDGCGFLDHDGLDHRHIIMTHHTHT